MGSDGVTMWRTDYGDTGGRREMERMGAVGPRREKEAPKGQRMEKNCPGEGEGVLQGLPATPRVLTQPCPCSSTRADLQETEMGMVPLPQ